MTPRPNAMFMQRMRSVLLLRRGRGTGGCVMDLGAVHQGLSCPVRQCSARGRAHVACGAGPAGAGEPAQLRCSRRVGDQPVEAEGVASCRGTPTVSDLVATHGSGLRRYVLVERPNAQLVRRLLHGQRSRPGRHPATDSSCLLHHSPTDLRPGRARRQVCTHEPLEAATNSKSSHPEFEHPRIRAVGRHVTAPSSPGSSRASNAFPAATAGGPESWEAFNRRYFADK
jgi:hypothetical protein